METCGTSPAHAVPWLPAIRDETVIDKKQFLVINTRWDRLTLAEVKAHQDQLLSDPDFSPEPNQHRHKGRHEV